MKARHEVMVATSSGESRGVPVLNTWDTYNIDGGGEEDIWVDVHGIWKAVNKFLLAALIGALVMIVAVRSGDKVGGGVIPVVSVEYVQVDAPQ